MWKNERLEKWFETCLGMGHVDKSLHGDYLKWFRYYIDFCHKYKHPYREKGSVRVFRAKLLEKGRSGQQQEQAQQCLNLLFDFLSKSKTATVDQKRIDLVKNTIKQMSDELKLQHKSPKTAKSYINWARQFFNHFQKEEFASPDQSRVKEFLTHLAVKRDVASSTQNQAFNALLFLFRYVLKKPFDNLQDTVRARSKRKIPVVLTKDEVTGLLNQFKYPYDVLFKLIYGCGLRLSEAINLRVKDIDFGNNTVFVLGKGDKSRSLQLPQKIHNLIKKHLEKVRSLYENDIERKYGGVPLPHALKKKNKTASKDWCWQWVFPSKSLFYEETSGKNLRYHIHDTSVQKEMKKAVFRQGISKPASVHTLRHSYATHLLQAGMDIRTVQENMGHGDVRTTLIYLHVLEKQGGRILNPLDI